MVSLWVDDESVIILNVGVLLIFWRWMVWVRCNIHGVINLFCMRINLVPVRY